MYFFVNYAEVFQMSVTIADRTVQGDQCEELKAFLKNAVRSRELLKTAHYMGLVATHHVRVAKET